MIGAMNNNKVESNLVHSQTKMSVDVLHHNKDVPTEMLQMCEFRGKSAHSVLDAAA